MMRRSAFARALWVLAILMVAIRVGDAHLHLCADGQEQRVSLHVADAPGQHHADEAQSDHDDRDLDFSGPTLTKKVGILDDLQLATLPTSTLLQLLPVAKSIAPTVVDRPVTFSLLFVLRPPLRGPPV